MVSFAELRSFVRKYTVAASKFPKREFIVAASIALPQNTRSPRTRIGSAS